MTRTEWKKKDILLTIMGKCNLNCKYCNLTYPKTHLPLSKIKEILKGKKDWYVILSGGEPTLHPEFDEIIEWLESEGYEGQVISNGSNVSKLLKLNKFRINLSLSTINIANMNEKDLVTWQALPKLKRAGKKIALSVVFDNNFEDTKALLDFAVLNEFSVTLNLYTQIKDDVGGINYHSMDMKIDINEANMLANYYQFVYSFHGHKLDWFITPETLWQFIRMYAKGEFLKCNFCDDNMLVYHPNGAKYNCCIKKINPKACSGCLDICNLNIMNLNKER